MSNPRRKGAQTCSFLMFNTYSGIYFSIWPLERKCSPCIWIHGKINSENCREQFWVQGVERKSWGWSSGVRIGHRTEGEYTACVWHSSDLNIMSQIRHLDQICTLNHWKTTEDTAFKVCMCVALCNRNVLLFLLDMLHIGLVTHIDSPELPHNFVKFISCFLCVLSASPHLSTSRAYELLTDWQMDSERPSVASSCPRTASPAYCIVSLPLFVHNIGWASATQS